MIYRVLDLIFVNAKRLIMHDCAKFVVMSVLESDYLFFYRKEFIKQFVL